MTTAASFVLALTLAAVLFLLLGGCYAIGHEHHTPAEHARIMQEMNEPEPPGGY